MSSMADRILDAAEARMRASGYNAVSFRELAADVGVKSSSVHYHFPTKTDLGVSLVERYAAQCFAALKTACAGDATAEQRVEAMIALHAGAFAPNRSICLCALLSAESVGLPDRVADAVETFSRASLGWLREAFETAGDEAARAETRAAGVLAALQGGLLIAAATRDGAYFAHAADGARAIAAGAQRAPISEGRLTA